MKYKYTGAGNFFPGLPAVDLDDGDLSADQQDLLAVAIEQGMYSAVRAAKPVTKAPAGVIDTVSADRPQQSTTKDG